MTPDAPQRDHSLREVFNALRWPWHTVYDQTQRWLRAGSFQAIVHDLRALLRLAQERDPQPSAVIFEGRTLQSTPESGGRAGYDGHKRKKGSKTHIAVDTLGHLLAMVVTPANEQERAQVGQLAEEVQEVTGGHVELAFVDQGYQLPSYSPDYNPIEHLWKNMKRRTTHHRSFPEFALVCDSVEEGLAYFHAHPAEVKQLMGTYLDHMARSDMAA